MRIIAVANQKGGCGKTTTSVALAWTLAARGRRTLLVDLDPQAHSTLSLGVNPEALAPHIGDILLASVFDPASPRLAQILQLVRENLWIAPAGVELSSLEHALAGTVGREERLAEHLAVLAPTLDEVIIDCPPSLGLLTFNALIAAVEAVVPVDSSPLSLHGIGRLKETVRLIHEMTGHSVRLRPIVTLFDPRTRVSRQSYELLRREFEGDAISKPIRYAVRLREKIGKGRIRSALVASGSPAEDYGALAVQLLEEERAGSLPETDHEVLPVLSNIPCGLVLSFGGRSPEDALIAGDFNGWVPDRGVRLEHDENGHWRKILNLGAGTYQYRFVVRGQWVPDPRNPHAIGNAFGGSNSLIQVE